MKQPDMRHRLKIFSLLGLTAAMFVVAATVRASAAELVMFEQAGCAWCDAFDNEIGVIYGKTDDGLRAPLRHVDISQPAPADLAFIRVERLTPLFVLVDGGREIGRIRGYPGREMFWMQLYTLMRKLDDAHNQQARAAD